jgi:1-phosphofructokinase
VLPIGGASGEELTRLLTTEGVAFRGIAIAGAVRVNISLREADGTTTKINTPGPLLTAGELAALLAEMLDATVDADWVVASGSLPPGAPEDFFGILCAAVHSCGARFALDTSGIARARGIAAGPDLIKPNVEELAQVSAQPILTFADAVAGARDLVDRGARSVVVSAGPDGAFYVDSTTAIRAYSVVDEPTSTVGARDALLAGLLTAGGGCDSLGEGLAWATASVSAPGSHVPRVTDAHRRRVVTEVGFDASTRLQQDVCLQTVPRDA